MTPRMGLLFGERTSRPKPLTTPVVSAIVKMRDIIKTMGDMSDAQELKLTVVQSERISDGQHKLANSQGCTRSYRDWLPLPRLVTFHSFDATHIIRLVLSTLCGRGG
jgi:hypothetical protein